MKHAFTVSLAATLITACAGGNSPEVIKPDLGGGNNVGQLTAGSQPFDIDGLGFKTATVNAKSIDGQFSYNDGEQITFLLGDTELFTVPGTENLNFSTALRQGYALPDTADAILAILDTRPGLVNTTLDPLHVLSNKMKLLLVLDNDRNPDNGIDLTDWHKRLTGTDIDLDQPLDRNDVFVKTFTGDLAAPVAIDVAEPLLTLYAMEGIQVSASRLVQHDAASNDLEFINSFKYNVQGALTEKDELTRRTSIDKDISRDTVEYAYDKFGLPREVRTTQLRNLDTDNPETYVGKDVMTNNGYLKGSEYPIVTFEESYSGTSDKDLALEYRFDGTYIGTQPTRLKEFHVNNNQSTSLNEYTFKYDSDGRETQERRDYISHDDAGEVIETMTNIFNTAYFLTNGDLISTRTEDLDNDGEINTTYVQRTRFNASGRADEREHSYYDSNNNLTFHRQQNFEFNNDGLAVKETDQRDPDKDGSVFENEYQVNIDVYDDQGVLVEQSRTFNPDNNFVTQTVTHFTYEQQGLTRGRMKTIVQTEQRWTWGTAEVDRPEPHRVLTYTYLYDDNSGRLTDINANQIYEGVENYRQTINLIYDADSNLTDYTITYYADNVGGTARVEAHHFTYATTDNGLGYLLHHQTREQLNSILNKTSVDYDIYFTTPTLIRVPSK